MIVDRALAEEVIRDHDNRPRHFGGLPDATHQAEGYDPFCGDRYTVRLRVAEGVVEAAAFQGFGCALSRASASILTELVSEQPHEAALALADHVEAVFQYGDTPQGLADLEALLAVREQPSRIKCVLLPWRALRSALSS